MKSTKNLLLHHGSYTALLPKQFVKQLSKPRVTMQWSNSESAILIVTEEGKVPTLNDVRQLLNLPDDLEAEK